MGINSNGLIQLSPHFAQIESWMILSEARNVLKRMTLDFSLHLVTTVWIKNRRGIGRHGDISETKRLLASPLMLTLIAITNREYTIEFEHVLMKCLHLSISSLTHDSELCLDILDAIIARGLSDYAW